MSRHSGHVEIWEQGGAWQWMYRDPEEDIALLGNRTCASRRAALAAARTAYPGVPVRPPGSLSDHLAGRTLLAAALGALGTGATLAARRRSDRRRPSRSGMVEGRPARPSERP